MLSYVTTRVHHSCSTWCVLEPGLWAWWTNRRSFRPTPAKTTTPFLATCARRPAAQEGRDRAQIYTSALPISWVFGTDFATGWPRRHDLGCGAALPVCALSLTTWWDARAMCTDFGQPIAPRTLPERSALAPLVVHNHRSRLGLLADMCATETRRCPAPASARPRGTMWAAGVFVQRPWVNRATFSA